MPSALETLVKILKLERQQGYKNTAVIGGLSAFSENWRPQGHTQARRPEHHALVDELYDRMREYEKLGRDARHEAVEYMLNRITGRLPAPPEYANREYPQIHPTAYSSMPESPSQRAQEAPPREEQRTERQREEREAQRQKGGGKARQQQEAQQGRRDQRQKGGAQGQNAPRGEAGDESGSSADYSSLDMEFRGSPNGGGRLDIAPPPRLTRPPRAPRPSLSPEQAEDILRGLSAPVDKVKGIGPKMAEMLNRLGLRTINDMLFYLPRRYDDYTRLSYISRLQPDQIATVIGTVRATEVRIARAGRKDFYMTVDDGSAMMEIIFFGQFYLNRIFRAGQQVVLHGQTSLYGHRIRMANPEWEIVDVDDLKQIGIVPVYGLTEGLTGKTMRRLMKQTVDYWSQHVPDYVPESVLDRTELGDLGWTIKNLHFPESWDHLAHAKRRFVFDQLLLLQLAILGNRRIWQSQPGIPLRISDERLEEIITTLFPFPLTSAQRRAIEDIRRDIATDIPMNRLLQGDVGSGKTAVAVAALSIAFLNGKQAALMAPTSILAEQHYRNISAAMERFPADHKPSIALLTGATRERERQDIYEGLADGSIDIVIGTHALIQENVLYRDLALAIIDEQHRFGVEQRGALRGKGVNPHLLVMTATPIPRTLALTLYADLDLTLIDEMPPGRIPIRTRVIDPVQRERAYNFVEDQLNAGRQAFIVYPLVEASDRIDAENAIEAHERLKKIFYHHKVGLLHGRMKPAEKDAIMNAFRQGNFDVLVTTSVAEVGVDIPNASIIMIEGAERFGLAQLHQFRGRVGRGGHASYCLLVCESTLPEARERLRALEQFNDGFKLAEIDWKLRGPGDLIGTRQSGQSMIKLAEDITPELVELAQREARTLYAADPLLEQDEHRLLAARVGLLRDERSDLS